MAFGSFVPGVVLALSLAAPLWAQGAAEWSRADSAVLRLAPSVFPALPSEVRRDLERRECLIPQVYDEPAPHNIARGAFTGAGRHEWAVLCSVHLVSRILIYGEGAASPVDSLAEAGDAGFLQTVGGGRIGYSRGIGIASPQRILRQAERYGGPPPPRPLDHDGIEDAFAGKASVIYYFHRGRWLRLQGAD